MNKEFVLNFVDQHRSLKGFKTVKLPKVAVISGPNGCGKTQLLESIDAGRILATDIDSKALVSKVFHSTPSLIASHVKIQDLDDYKYFVTDARALLSSLEKCLENEFSADVAVKGVWQKVNRKTIRDALIDCMEKGAGPKFRGDKKEYYENSFISTQPGAEDRSRWGGFKKYFPLSSLTSREEFNERELVSAIYELVQYQTFMEVDVSTIFYRYFEEYQDNAYRRASNTESIDDDGFESKYGKPPWNEINSLLESYGFSHRFVSPCALNDPKATKGFTAYLVSENGDKIGVQELSSGEQVIIALLLSAYAAQQNQINLLDIHAPDLLLFDELDAHLHPSMTRMMFDVIENHMLQQLDCRVLLTTHSPTTVALAYKNSNYCLTSGKQHVLEPIDAVSACRQLADGFVQVMDGSQIVIVEGKDDPLFYRAVENALRTKTTLIGTPALHFIPASQTQDTSSGGGAKAAADWAEKLNAANLPNVHALLDNDGHRQTIGAIKVLSGRYSIENFLLDPLSLAVTLIIDGKLIEIDSSTAKLFPLVSSIGEATLIDIQKLVDVICNFIQQNSPHLSTTTSSSVPYVSDISLDLPTWIFETRGKDLASHIREAIKTIDHKYIVTRSDSGNFNFQLGYLLKNYCQYPQYFPMDLANSLNSLSPR